MISYKDMSPDELEKEIQKLVCQDNSCVAIEHRGVGTNGGCNCVDWRVMTPADRLKLKAILTMRKIQVKKLNEEVHRLDDELYSLHNVR